MGIPILARRLQRLVTSNAPAILTAIGASGVVGTAVLAVKATPEAIRRINEAEDSTPFEEGKPRHRWYHLIKIAWKPYIPAVLTGTTAIAAIIGANSINGRRIAAGLSAVSILETGYKEYKDKVITALGDKKEQAIRDEIAGDKVAKHDHSTEVIITGNGDVLCYDTLTDRTFLSTIEKVRKAVNDINQICLLDMSASQNEFYRLIGLPPTRLGEDLGWKFDRLMEIEFSSHLTSDGRPCLALTYAKPPVSNFYKINS